MSFAARISFRGLSTNLSKLPAGQPGRNARTGNSITVFGATGFVGRYLVNELGRTGNTLVVATQGDDMGWRHLKPLADYGKLTPAYMNLKDEDSIRKAIQGSDVVVNLQGKHYETKHAVPGIYNWKFEDLHVKGAEKLARIAREEDVKHFVQLSSVAAQDGAKSRWAETKNRGDKAVTEQFPGAVIVKSNVIYGEEDRLLNWYARMMRNLPAIPLVEGGQGKIRPVYVGDVAQALGVIVTNWVTAGKTFQLNGEHTYTYKEVAEFVAEQVHKPIKFVDIPAQYAKYVGMAFEKLPNPILTDDIFDLLQEDQLGVSGGAEGFEALNIKPADFEQKGYNFLYKYRTGGHFNDPRSERVGEHL
mmetsp:Transcript_2762/g.3531  ORF Transcript_2762/g.3531 Transcript_2762/m.3531 type:complete len:360 (-) Transcript_2762:283-1362(-)|eukprot:CAMPEP_0204835690 /NCGR_PEP_ID=MMETSP1346-20131115/23342_1 /ASSEMBLY_ACC=CAM_ASM_000771 /TAXON_ID=215587 /ORGANISM="Aplanochytrium stocchinoi, Strain GSBS06" /LENGTH=359 /DNA_ID=CAMNT_0051969915 /DNA_START=240 /DNA_END=1319 /DNA_ORIENTATION=-